MKLNKQSVGRLVGVAPIRLPLLICLMAFGLWGVLIPRSAVADTPACVGDCNTDGHVTVDELIMMVNITLGNADISLCHAGDVRGDGHMTVDEIVMGVNNALNGCPVVTPTPTPTITPTATETFGSTFARIQSQVFNVSCSSDSCHSSVGRAGNMVLEDGSAWHNLVNVSPSNPVAVSQGLMRVMPGNPDSSFLMAKIADNLSAGEGQSMPWGVALLTPETVDIIRAWILAGAPQDGIVPGDDGRPLGGGGEKPGDIALPPPAKGVQLQVTADPVPQGTEVTSCHYFKLPSDIDLEVNRFQVAVSGGSHHIHLYRPYDSTLNLPDGAEVCNMAVDFDKWELVVATQLRHSDWELPAGVAYHFHAGEQLLMQTHFVNVGSLETDGPGKVLMNLNTTDPANVTAHAGAIFGQNKDVFVPAHSTPTATAECVFPKQILLMGETGHYHFRGRHFWTYRWDNNTLGDLIYEYVGYDDPPFKVHDPALVFTAGQGLQWECYWENNTDTDYPFGPFTDTNEHCNWFGFYYPTDSANEAITCVKKDGVSVTTVRSPQ